MKLAIIGSGMIVNDFLTMIGDIPKIQLEAIVGTERSSDKMRLLKDKHGINQVLTNYEDCFEKR